MRVGPTLEQLLKEYPNDVRIVFKQHPLPMHSQAGIAAEAAMAANAQGKFLEMHNRLMASSGQLSREKILAFAQEMGLNVPRFTKDLDENAHKAEIDLETKEAMDVGANGTPASFINGRYLSGAAPYQAFKRLVDEELKWAKDGKRPAFITGQNVREAAAPLPVAAAQVEPDPARNYDIPVGSAPAFGSSKARVTILHYTDYQ